MVVYLTQSRVAGGGVLKVIESIIVGELTRRYGRPSPAGFGDRHAFPKFMGTAGVHGSTMQSRLTGRLVTQKCDLSDSRIDELELYGVLACAKEASA
jgi:hypothetical protein